MSLYKELKEAIDELVGSANETDEFKRRFTKTIENYFENNYQESDISELIDLVSISEDRSNGD